MVAERLDLKGGVWLSPLPQSLQGSGGASYFVATLFATVCSGCRDVACNRLPQSPAKGYKRTADTTHSQKLKDVRTQKRGPRCNDPGPSLALVSLIETKRALFYYLLLSYQPQEEAAADCWTACSHSVAFSGANSISGPSNSCSNSASGPRSYCEVPCWLAKLPVWPNCNNPAHWSLLLPSIESSVSVAISPLSSS